MISYLQLISGTEIPFKEAQINIHQPTLKEISFIGEETFFIGCELLNFSKNVFLSPKDKINLGAKSNFEVFMSIMKDNKTLNLQKNRMSAFLVLTLMFPTYEIAIGQDKIIFSKEDEVHYLEEKNFDAFKDIVVSIFCLKRQNGNNELNYNPAGQMAKDIAEKLKKGRQKVAALKGDDSKEKDIRVFSRYLSILAVGERKSFNDLLQYTVFQIYDEFERFELKHNYDLTFRAKLAGAKDIEEVDNWMKDIHS